MKEISDIAKMSARRKNLPSGLILAERIRGGETPADLAAEYDVSKSTVTRAVNDAGLSALDGTSTVGVRVESVRLPLVGFGYLGHSDALDEAACVGEDPELFFPESAAERRINGARAKAICAGCPARVACLARTLEEERGYAGRWGIRGGLDEAERAALVESGAA